MVQIIKISLAGDAERAAPPPAAEGPHWGMGGARTAGLFGGRTRSLMIENISHFHEDALD